MPGDHERQMVLTVLAGISDYFKENPDAAGDARDMWTSDGNSVRVLRQMIEFRCKEKAAEGEESRLEPFNDEGGAERLRAMIKSYSDDEEVAKYLGKMSGGSRK